MKANEAPEKIYVHKSQYWGLRANEHDITKNGIKYVRTDAFIEKAVGHINGLIEFLNEFGHQLKKERIIEDFKKYMED